VKEAISKSREKQGAKLIYDGYLILLGEGDSVQMPPFRKREVLSVGKK